MAVFLAWTGTEELPPDLPGPWTELRTAGPGLLLVESEDTLSRVYHELKWAMQDASALLVAPLHVRPKLKGLAPGTTSWLGRRLPPGP